MKERRPRILLRSGPRNGCPDSRSWSVYSGGCREKQSRRCIPHLGHGVQYLADTYLSDIVDSIARACSFTRLMRSQSRGACTNNGRAKIVAWLRHNTSFRPFRFCRIRDSLGINRKSLASEKAETWPITTVMVGLTFDRDAETSHAQHDQQSINCQFSRQSG